MSREDFLILTALLLIGEGYLLGSVVPALAGFFIAFYILLVRSRANVSVSGEVDVLDESVEEGNHVRVAVRLINHGDDVRARLLQNPSGFDFEPLELFLKGGEIKEPILRLFPKGRGVLRIPPFRLLVEEPRGLYGDELTLGEGSEVKVYPSIDSLREGARVRKNILLAESFRKSPLSGTESLEIKDLREYRHGDDFKRVDWKASARLGELIVRDFLRESDSDVYIVLDNTREMRKGIERAKIDYASILVLQLVSLISKRYRVGLVIYDELSADVIPPGKGSPQVERIRKKLSLGQERSRPSLSFGFEVTFGERARGFLRSVLPLMKGRKGSLGVFEALSLIRNHSYLIFISDLSNPRELYRAILRAKGSHRVILLSPNPVLFYPLRLDERTLERLYRAYTEREELIRRFNALVPTLDLGPSDYLQEILKTGALG